MFHLRSRHAFFTRAAKMGSDPIRIAVFTYGLPTATQKRGGIERIAHQLAQGLSHRGHQVTVFSHDPAPAGARYEVRELPWRTFVSTWAGRRLTMGYLGNVLAILPDYHAFDAVIAHGDSLLLPLVGKPIVRVMHGSALMEARHATSPGRFLLQAGVYLQELLTALLQPATVAVSENARRANPLIRRVIPNGIDTTVFHPAPAGKTITPSIVFVGALGGRKQGRFLLDIFSNLVRPAYPDAELMFVGEAGPAIAGVTYYTGVTDEELASIYSKAWVYASPSTYEGFGLPYVEAMACGTAVLAVPNPGSIEILNDGEFGRLADAGRFAAALVDLLGNSAARHQLEGAGLARARHFSSASMVEKYEQLLAELIQLHANPATTL